MNVDANKTGTDENMLDAFFGPGASAEIQANEEYLERARREDGVDYADHLLWGGIEAFIAHRNEVRGHKGLPTVSEID